MAAGIRKASRPDVDAIVDMVRSFYAESAYPFDAVRVFAAVDRLLSDPRNGAAWLVVGDGAPLGYGVLTFGFSIEYGGTDAVVDELWIAPGSRGEGCIWKSSAAIPAQSGCTAPAVLPATIAD
jgi:hypothetical protein